MRPYCKTLAVEQEVDELSAHCWRKYKKRVVITDVHRDDPDSPHSEWRAGDARANHDYWTTEQKREILEWLRVNFPRSDMEALEDLIPSWYGTARIHGDGANEHIHICVEPLVALHAAMGVRV